MVNSPLPWVMPRSCEASVEASLSQCDCGPRSLAQVIDSQPNMSLSGTSHQSVNSSSRISVSTMVPLRWLIPPMTVPARRPLVRIDKRGGRHGKQARTLELDRRSDVDLHNRLENDRTTLRECLAEGTLSSQAESQLGRVDLVSRAVLEDEFATRDLVARKRATLEGVAETLKSKHQTKSARP